MSKPIHNSNTNSAFWCETYHGRQIAIYQNSFGWVAYIDRVMQANRTFAAIEDAIRWLRREVDDATFDSRMAVLRGRWKPKQHKRMLHKRMLLVAA
jgi:hypothetical protein